MERPVALITGTLPGIGRSLAAHYVHAGQRVVGCSRRESDVPGTFLLSREAAKVVKKRGSALIVDLASLGPTPVDTALVRSVPPALRKAVRSSKNVEQSAIGTRDEWLTATLPCDRWPPPNVWQ